ncbi:MAG: tetratricopeptide repeat protein [Sulfurospirillum sp.]
MSRYNTTLILLTVFLFVGCSVKTPTVQIGKKAFQNEDIMIVTALEAQRIGRYTDAMKIFQTLYEKTQKVNYLTQVAKMSFLAQDYKKTLALLKNAVKKYPQNEEFKKLLVGIYIKEKKYDDAQKIALELLKKNRNPQTLSILGDIYMLQKSYDLALKYYESAFRINNSSKTLLNMANLLYKYLDRKQEAISYLETYIRLQDAGERVYFTLIKIYGEEKNINGLISTYKKLYYKFKRDEYGKKVIELLMYKRDRRGAIDFLEKSDYDPKMLIDIYTSLKDFKNAYKIAQKLYKQTNNSDYLGKMAIYQYEENKDHLNPKILASISKKFEAILKDRQDPLYLNYYGYLLIDHNLNVKKGIRLVKLALKKEPESVFYLDSLAWGYYKLNKCQKALDIMKKFIDENSEPEVTMHYNKILNCLKEKK